MRPLGARQECLVSRAKTASDGARAEKSVGGRLRTQRRDWQFPGTISAPKPVQQPHPPNWVAARASNSHAFAVANGCNAQSTPLHLGDEKVVGLMNKFYADCAKFAEMRAF